MLGGLFGGGGSSSYKIPDISGQVKKTIKPIFDPYTDMGKQTMGTLQEQLARMYQDPGALMNQIGSGYQQSPGYQFQVDQATEAAKRAAAAGGQLGSPAMQEQLAHDISGIASQDYGNYMNRAMGLYGQGIQGLTGLTGLGYQAASTEAEDLARAQMAQAGMDVGMQQAGMQQQSDIFGALSGLGGFGLGKYFGLF